MARFSVMMCCSTALLLVLASCSAERTDDPLMDPATRPMDAAPPGTTPTDVAAAMLTVASGPDGDYLADTQGRALYMLEGDTDGSMCAGPCLQAWPPLVVGPAAPPGPASGATTPGTAQADVRSALVGTIKRADNTTQVTYNGQPLYYYDRDPGPGMTLGHGVGEWYLLTPRGDKLAHED